MATLKGKIIASFILLSIILLCMALFGLCRKKNQAAKNENQVLQGVYYTPYKDSSANFIYNLLFCDNLSLFKKRTTQPYTYPMDILLSDTAHQAGLQKIIDDSTSDPRFKLLAYNLQSVLGHRSTKKELLAVIVEVGLNDGLDVLASFNDGTARYINQTGKMLIWEIANDTAANRLTKELFASSQQIIQQIGRWQQPRRPQPAKGNARITFLVSDGLYFGEASSDILFADQLAGPAMEKAAMLMQYITAKSLEKQ